jgi:hypothetical protein
MPYSFIGHSINLYSHILSINGGLFARSSYSAD